MTVYLLSPLTLSVIVDFPNYIGHSERRTLFGETSEVVAQKTKAAVDETLSVILCVGETLSEREAGTTSQVVQSQLDPVIKTLTEEQWTYV